MNTPKLDPNSIAPGHNPDKILVSQVGYEDGWRLLDPDEIRGRETALYELDVWLDTLKVPRWCNEPASNYYGASMQITYRTKLTREQLAKLSGEREVLGIQDEIWSYDEATHELRKNDGNVLFIVLHKPMSEDLVNFLNQVS
jgi:hypothetical protein